MMIKNKKLNNMYFLFLNIKNKNLLSKMLNLVQGNITTEKVLYS